MKRIICLLLVVVMLSLSLISCGYYLADDEMTEYATFDKAKFEEAIKNLVIEDGKYKVSERDALQLDKIYTSLKEKAGTTKVYEGVVDGNDVLYYCYYITFEKDGKTYTVVDSDDRMNTSKATSAQLGLSTLTGYVKELEKKIGESEIELKDYAYSIKSSGDAAEGQIAYITYTTTVTTTNAEGKETSTDTTYTKVKVTLTKDSANPVVKKLLEKKTIGSTIESFTDEATKVKYSNAKIDWIVEETKDKKYKEIVLAPVVEYTETKKVSAVTGDVTFELAKEVDLKDVELTYHVCPVSLIKVEDLTAEVVIKTLLSSNITVDTFEIFKDQKTSIDAFTAKVKALTELEKKLSDAEDELEAAKKSLDDVKKTVPEGEDVESNKAVQDATDNVTAKQEAIDGNGKDKKGLKKEVEEAEAAVDTALIDVFKAVGEAKKTAAGEDASDDIKNADATELGKTEVIAAYKETVHKSLLAEHNTAIKNNIAKALWAAMTDEKNITFKDELPTKVVDEMFDRLMQEHQYDFRKTSTNYKDNNGSFEEYLIKTTKVTDKTYEAAEAKVMEDAKALVKELVTIYLYAQAYEQSYTEEELKDYKNDASGVYEEYVYYRGETLTLAAFQFDKLFNFFLEVETKTVTEDGKEVEEFVYDDNGEYKFTNELIKFEKKGEEESK